MSISPVELVQSLVRCASVTPDDAGAQRILKKILYAAGFDVYDLPFDGRGSYPVKNFFARIGTGFPHICFAGHTDVVPAGEEKLWSSPPFAAEISDGKIIGRGTSDMKGGVAALVAAACEFVERYGRPDGSISFLITGDEEADAVNGTVRVLEWMEEKGHVPDACIVGEPSNDTKLGQAIRVGRRGSINRRLKVTGKQGSVAFQQFADNPLPRLIGMLHALCSYRFDEGSEFFQPTNLEVTKINVDNDAVNVIPMFGEAMFNVRFSDKWSVESLDAKIKEILDSVSRKYELEKISDAESFITKPVKLAFMLADAAEKVTGSRPEFNTGGGTSDARFIYKYCPVVEFGLRNESIHQIDEHLYVDELLKLTQVYVEVLKTYFGR